jgi:hypothetical protein
MQLWKLRKKVKTGSETGESSECAGNRRGCGITPVRGFGARARIRIFFRPMTGGYRDNRQALRGLNSSESCESGPDSLRLTAAVRQTACPAVRDWAGGSLSSA